MASRSALVLHDKYAEAFIWLALKSGYARFFTYPEMDDEYREFFTEEDHLETISFLEQYSKRNKHLTRVLQMMTIYDKTTVFFPSHPLIEVDQSSIPDFVSIGGEPGDDILSEYRKEDAFEYFEIIRPVMVEYYYKKTISTNI
jgi:hypothetical protein